MGETWDLDMPGHCAIIWFLCCCCLVAKSCPTLCNLMDCSMPGFPIHPSPTPRTCSNSWSIELVMPSNHLSLCHPLLLLSSVFPSIRLFSKESVLCIRWPSTGASASASVLPMNIQSWLYSGLTGLISGLLQRSKRQMFLSRKSQTHNISYSSFPEEPEICNY